MAKLQAVDKLQGYRFRVSFLKGSGVPNQLKSIGRDVPINLVGGAEAGFNTCVVPEVNIEQVEYNEGNNLNRIKQPGLPSYGDVTLTRGVAFTDTAFWQWVRDVAMGLSSASNGTYRADVLIEHMNRAGLTQRSYTLYEAFPTRCKVSSDMDASSSEISISDLDIAFEKFEMKDAYGKLISIS